MKVKYGNESASFDITSTVISTNVFKSDIVHICDHRAECFGLPPLKDATITVEDDFDNKAEFAENDNIFIERTGKKYQIRLIDDLAPISSGTRELPIQILVNKFVSDGDCVLEVSDDKEGGISSVIARLIGDETRLVSMRSDKQIAASAFANASKMGHNIAIEGKILSSVPLAKNVNMVIQANPDVDDPSTWTPVDTISLDELAEKYPILQSDPIDVLVLGCHHDKFRPLIADYPRLFTDAQCVIMKVDFRLLYEIRNFQKELTAMGFVNVTNIGASAHEADICFMSDMYQAWKKNV